MAARRHDPEVIAEWTVRLQTDYTDLQSARAAVHSAQEKFRRTVCDAFDAGLTVVPIQDAIGLTKSRLYQIKAGRRT